MSNSTVICNAEESAFAVPFPGNYVLVLFLLCLSALFSGLTLGLLGLDKMGLQIVIGGEDALAKKYAQAILPVRENGNLLLCTLLLGNVAVNALLSILMADMTSGLVGFLSSTILIVIFGEIIPQASCSRHALFIGYYSLPVVKCFIVLFYVLACPLGYMLDKVLGEDLGTIHSKQELRKMLALHVEHGAVDADSGNVLDGALTFRDMLVQEVMTTRDDIFMLSIEDRLDFKVLSEIFKVGCSRIPIFGKDRNDIVGLMLAKDLLFVDPDDLIPIRVFMTHFGRQPACVWPDQKLGEVLKIFLKNRSHMAIVRDVNNIGPGDPFYEVVGLITLEDIVEEILGSELKDEMDDYDDIENGPTGKTTIVSVKNRDRDFIRLALLHGDMTREAKLSADEIQAIVSHLNTNVPEFRKVLDAQLAYHTGATMVGNSGSSMKTIPVSITTSDISNMVSKCKVVDLKRISTADEITALSPKPDDVLYTRGKVSASATLILSGKVIILAGQDGFRSEIGPWSVLGMGALYGDSKINPKSDHPAQYVPDFTAFIASDSVRCVRITLANILPMFRKLKLVKGESVGSISDSGVKTSNVNSAAVVGLSGVELVGMNNCSTPVQSNANTKAGGRIKSLSADGIV